MGGGQPSNGQQYDQQYVGPNQQQYGQNQWGQGQYNQQQAGPNQWGNAQPYSGMPDGPAPKKSNAKRNWLIALGAVVLLGGIGSLTQGNKDSEQQASPAASQTSQAQTKDEAANASQSAPTQSTQPTTAAQPTAEKTEDKKADQPAAKIGTPVKAGDREFKITNYKCGESVEDPINGQLKPQGQWCVVDVEVKNVGKQQITVDDDQIKVLDAAGVEYSTSSDTLYVDGTIFLKAINPGNSITGKAFYDIPKNVKPVKATVKGSLFSKKQEIALS